MRTRSQGRRLVSLLVSTWPGAEARHPQPSALCDPEAFPLPAAPAAGLKCRAKQLPLGVSNTRSSSHAGQPESVSPDTFLWPQPEEQGSPENMQIYNSLPSKRQRNKLSPGKVHG